MISIFLKILLKFICNLHDNEQEHLILILIDLKIDGHLKSFVSYQNLFDHGIRALNWLFLARIIIL